MSPTPVESSSGINIASARRACNRVAAPDCEVFALQKPGRRRQWREAPPAYLARDSERAGV